MISFSTNEGKFSFRVAGVCIHEDKLLVHRSSKDTYWTLPGGRLEMGESTEEGLKREMIEEIGEVVCVDGLYAIAENFFRYEGENLHELGFYYHITLPTNSMLLQQEAFKGIEKDTSLHYKWMPLTSLDEITLYPRVLAEKIKRGDMVFSHMVNREG
ncbi:NUDIX hydrolase [Priestia taiwanensis]|uniref:DNA mismatch repair protein MutT n=1 Tax=Priestia taiwanensis TaxID=1347902 RepID=A0A917AR83_9BACI|nr:NUDIX hydrolase [Priestia taiwanensis]MBM7362998.1 ADP-ribose pyrophosphatase YjhB (NUDIX family) [Priestia taiwanensis]GGE66804.1 DNA mismatch repair protein MutT [Priestia taiwanensis]